MNYPIYPMIISQEVQAESTILNESSLVLPEKRLKVLELFAGTRSIGKAFEARGHEVFSVDWSETFEGIDLRADVLTLTPELVREKFGDPDIIWASPDCTTYSIAAISHHRRQEEDGNLAPVSDYAKTCDRVNQHLLALIRALAPQYWFIENPRGGLRKMRFMRGLPRYTVTYCQYGDMRMKPTDIFTNHPDPDFLPMCHNGDPCHERAPRGAKTGTQGLRGHVERSRIPQMLCEHIVDICERYIEGQSSGADQTEPAASSVFARFNCLAFSTNSPASPIKI